MSHTQVDVSAKNTANLIQDYAARFNAFFGFCEAPFNNTPDPSFFYESRNHQEVLTGLLFGVLQRKGFIVVTGEIGAGKTTLCRQFLKQLPPTVRTAVVLNPSLSSTHLLAAITQDFGIQVKGRTKRDYFDALNRFLLDGLEKDLNACLIIDESQCLSARVLEEVRLLSNLETYNQKLLQIVLMGQPELKDTLSLERLTQLRQRVNVHCHLKGLDLAQTLSYLEHRLRTVSGGKQTVFFRDEVVSRIHELSRGIPRLINALADRILMAAYLHETRDISPEIARSAFEEMAFICEGRRKETKS